MAANDADPPESETARPMADVDARAKLSPEALRKYLASPETVKRVTDHVRAKVAPQDVGEVVGDVFQEALVAPPPDDEARLTGWLSTITARVIADRLAKAKRRAKYEAPMPEWSAEGDDDAVQAQGAVPEPSFDAREDEHGVHGFFILRWIARQTAELPRDRETFEILLEHERDAKQFAVIAKERGLTETALRWRVSEFKATYVPRYRRWRNRTALLLLLGGMAAVALVWWLLARAQPPRAAPDRDPRPPPSATRVAPHEDPLYIAGRLRREAFDACDAQKWDACEGKLDEARALDPAGEDNPLVQQARRRAQAARRPDDGGRGIK